MGLILNCLNGTVTVWREVYRDSGFSSPVGRHLVSKSMTWRRSLLLALLNSSLMLLAMSVMLSWLEVENASSPASRNAGDVQYPYCSIIAGVWYTLQWGAE